MDTKLSTNRKFKRIFVNILSIVVILAIAFPAMGSVSAQGANPWFTVFPEQGVVEGWDWPLDATIYMTIDDPGTPDISPDYWQDGTMELVPWDLDSGGTWLWIDFSEEYSVKPGDVVTLSLKNDGTMERTHEVQNLLISEIDPYENIVSGMTNDGQVVVLWSWEDPEGRRIETDGSGNWAVDFDDIGFDLEPGYHVRAEVWGVHGNDTAVDRYVTNPHFTIFPEWEWFDGLDWPDGATVAITVEGKEDVCTTEGTSSDYFFNGGFPEGCDVEFGDVVTFTYGETIRKHTVQNLTVTKANHEDDTIKGIADPGAEVYVWPHATGEQQLAIAKTQGAAQGKWHVDFSGVYDLTPGECGRSEIRDEYANSTAVDWCISNPRIVASESGDWFWTTEFKPGDLDISIYDSPDENASLLWSGQQVADESGFAFVGSDIHGLDLAPGNYLVISDGDSQKSLMLQPISVTMFDTQYEFMAGFAPAGSEVWAAAGPQDWQERIMVETDPDTGEWFANFTEIGFNITEDMQPSSYAQIFDDDGDANEADPPPLESWVAVFTYDPPNWTEDEHSYYFENTYTFPEPYHEVLDSISFTADRNAPRYNGFVQMRFWSLIAQMDGECSPVDSLISPDQLTRFEYGWLTDYPMTYDEALAHFDSMTVNVYWDDGGPVELSRHEIMSYSEEDWPVYSCSLSDGPPKMDLRVNYGHDWVESFYEAEHEVAITVTESDGETIKATAQVQTAPREEWGGEEGFQTTPEDWYPAMPDLQPYDWVYAQVDNGATAQVQIGDVWGEVNIFTDSVSGTVRATWFDGPIQVECLDWGSGGEPFGNKDGGIIPTDGSALYSCTWAGEWNIQSGQTVGVGYIGPDGHWVANAFSNDRIAAVGNFNIEWSQTNPEEVIYLSRNGSDNLTRTIQHPACSNDLQYFGNSWVSENEGTDQFFFGSLVGWGTTGDWLQSDSMIDIQSISSDCPGSANIPIKTQYQFFDDDLRANLIVVQRIFEFGTDPYDHNIRPFIPRLFPIYGFSQVLHPNASSTILVTQTTEGCSFGCMNTDWDGSWFAMHNPDTGEGMILRHVTSGQAVALWLDDDGGTDTNATSVLLLHPDGGFTDTVTETEYLCFYDSSTWTPSLTLPEGCQP